MSYETYSKIEEKFGNLSFQTGQYTALLNSLSSVEDKELKFDLWELDSNGNLKSIFLTVLVRKSENSFLVEEGGFVLETESECSTCGYGCYRSNYSYVEAYDVPQEHHN